MSGDKIRDFEIKKICLSLLILKGIEENFRLREAYLRGYRDGILALKSNS